VHILIDNVHMQQGLRHFLSDNFSNSIN